MGGGDGVAALANDNYHLADGAVPIDRGRALPAELATNHPLLHQYVEHHWAEDRPDDGYLDMGAWEIGGGLPGDLDDSGEVDLVDAVIALKILAGYQRSVILTPENDLGADGQVTMAEAIFALEELAK